MPEVTVLTAVRNGARFLPAALASVLAQAHRDLELLVVDDASDDGTPALVERAAAADPRVRLLRRAERGGPFVAANDGLRAARGRWIARLDADDVMLPGRLARQLAFLRAHPALRACATFARGLDAEGRALPDVNDAPRTSGVLAWYLCLRCPLVHSTACVAREAFAAIGGYRPLPLAQDARLWCELARRGWVGVVPEVLTGFRRHEGRLTRTRTAEQMRLGKDVVRDHVEALTGERLAEGDVHALYAVGHAEHFPVPHGLEVLRWWDARWGADRALAPAERRELAALSAFRRRKFLRVNARVSPLAVARQLHRFVFAAPGR